MKPALTIDFVSDVACPWCAVGLGALERALQKVQGEMDVALHFQPFELNPQMAPEGEDVDEHLTRKYGGTPEQFARSRAAIRERGAAVGFTFGERGRIYNTFDAHRLLHWAGLEDRHHLLNAGLEDRHPAPSAGLPGLQHALKAALLKAYHGQGRDISDHAVLLDVVGALGLDGLHPQRAAQILASDEFAADVRAAEQHWQEMGIHSVPSVVINGRHLIQGGQPPEVFEQALRQIAAG